MMDMKKSLYAFASIAVLAFCVLIGGAAYRQGWFASHVEYRLVFPSGEGIRVGTPVSISGFKAGQISQIELDNEGKVQATIRVQEKFAKYFNQETKVVLGRPFIIGERSVMVTPGRGEIAALSPGSLIVGDESLELTDLLSGGRLSPYFTTFSRLLEQLQLVIEGDGRDTVNLVTLYRQANTTLKAVEGLAKDVSVMRHDVIASKETLAVIKALSKSTDHMQLALQQSTQTMPAVTQMSQDVAAIMPKLKKTLDETAFTLQAMQRSFILRGASKDLKEELQQNNERLPASE
ncbi:MAG TPA: MlaD family protein [Bdellovibrionota bacterium]|jgi:ABC-type transporter Mla subunit MlaD|nr:MlaD family protein [Bdellovibrionota bacterium]